MPIRSNVAFDIQNMFCFFWAEWWNIHIHKMDGLVVLIGSIDGVLELTWYVHYRALSWTFPNS